MGTRKQKPASPVVTRHTRPVAPPTMGEKGLAGRDTGAEADEDIEDRIRLRLGQRNAAARNTVAVRVNDGRATTAGIVRSRNELNELEAVVRSTPGVIGYCNLAVIDHHRADDAASVAEAVAATIGFECRQSDVHVSVFGNTAVVSGHVDSPDDSLTLEVLAQSHRDVNEVVNRTTVVAASHED